ncbi:hypothetical protein INT45_011011 [Circinella minor]|uniref:DUF1748-domain-containing protein n=1 Tax=Circinella minor TaxID=1195481 RepID=A0A8H7VV40_9FUNG|nr:hypothetical protein INT45_011011 [Circinella minor]KAI7851030.1 DUF1748-domain-containing protein [Circinella umbellata]
MWNKLLHVTVDAILVSTFLAGVKRTTGLQPAINKIQNKEIRGYLESYLNFGEYVLDSAILIMNNSSYFERKQ